MCTVVSASIVLLMVYATFVTPLSVDILREYTTENIGISLQHVESARNATNSCTELLPFKKSIVTSVIMDQLYLVSLTVASKLIMLA